MPTIDDRAGTDTLSPPGSGSANAIVADSNDRVSVVTTPDATATRLQRIEELLRVGPPSRHRAERLQLKVRTFGGFQVLVCGVWIDGPPSKKGGQLVQRLITSPTRSVSREELIESYRSDLSTNQVANRLYLAASGARRYLRRCLGDLDVIRTTRIGYALSDDVRVDSDLSAFSNTYDQHDASAYERAIELYRGEFLAGEKAEWIEPIRTRCAAKYVDMLAYTAQSALDRGDVCAALNRSSAAVSADRGHERASCVLMRCFATLGQRGRVLDEYECLQRYLLEQFALKPSNETRATYYSLIR